MRLTRRQSLAGAGALLASGAAGAFAPTPSDSLAAMAARSGRRFGSALGMGRPRHVEGAFADPQYRAIMTRECGLIVPENELKWQWTRPSATAFDFANLDRLVGWAESQHLPVRGHTLLWLPQKWYPKWLVGHDFGPAAAKSGKALLTDHVRTVCRRYGARIHSYDVVNEAIQPETGKIRDTVLTRAIGGEATLDLMFHAAKAEAPHAELVYNDYMSWERNRVDETHIKGVLKLLEGFRKRGTPVDTLGVQSHIRLLKHLPVAQIVRESQGPWRRFLDEVVGMGYKLMITEFDVNDHMAPTNVGVRDRMVADYARAYLDLMFSYPQLRDVLAWGMADKYSWLEGFDPRADKTTKRGTPYDSKYRPKALRTAIADAFRSASSRHSS
jgi:endo-1,4-beta-xylanase